MRALWVAAPWALTRYATIFAAVVIAVALAAAAAASTPFVRAGIRSAALRGQVRSMSPLAAGFEVRGYGTAAGDRARRAAAVRFGRAHGFTTPPVLTSQVPLQLAGSRIDVVLMARTNAVAHVHRLAGGGRGVWISRVVEQTTHLHPGDLLPVTASAIAVARPPVVRLRIAGVYRALDADLGNPYWANFIQEIRARDPNAPQPPTFVLVRESTLLQLARTFAQGIANVYEFPVDARHVTYAGAQKLARDDARLARQLTSRRSGVGHALDCARLVCQAQTSIGSALLIAAGQVGAVSTTISLLSACALGIAFLIAAAAGVFLVRRRWDEAQLLYARGEAPAAFAARTAVEALLPAAVGLTAGVAGAVAALRLFAPAGTIDHATLVSGMLHGLVAAAAALAVLTLAAAASFPHPARRTHGWTGRARRLPWELLPLAGAAVLLGLLLGGAGLAKDADGHSHPRLAVFLLPVLAGPALGGLVGRAARRTVRGRGANAPIAVFLVLRRVAAARGLLVAVVVSAATAFGAFAYAQTLSSSLDRTAAEKAFVSNGSDVEGYIDASERIYEPFPFPATVAQQDSSDAFVGPGAPVDLIAGDPKELQATLRWGPWADDPRTRLPLLARSSGPAGVLPAIASPDFPHVTSITDQGVSIPLRIVARVPVPGAEAGRPALLVSSRTLHIVARLHHIADPGPGASGFIWAKGNPRVVEPALIASNLHPAFLTTLAHIREDASVVAGERSYRYLRAVGVAAVVLALLALLLYLQARQRGQRLASGLLRRMGLRARSDVAALALEAMVIAAAAAAVGTGVAVATARIIVRHVDPLPQYAPGTSLVYPWSTFLWAGAAATAIAGFLAALAGLAAARGDVAKELRVA